MSSLLIEYVNRNLGVMQMQAELKRLISEYNKHTQRSMFIYASDLNKGSMGIDVSLVQDDFYVVEDVLRNYPSNIIDFYLETPGGSGEAAEEIARFLHKKFGNVNFVIAGEAKSAGTILALCGDNILMCDTGSLGPIDAQVRVGRSVVSAYDYKKWIDQKITEAKTNGRLNAFDSTIIAQISPGEISGIVNSLEFAKDLVKEWLKTYKFKNWTITETRKLPVDNAMKEKRANEVAELLCDHSHWRSHGRSLKIEDLNGILQIEDIDKDKTLSDIVHRIKTVTRLLFDSSTIYKIFATKDDIISKSATIANPSVANPKKIIQPKATKEISKVELPVICPRCKKSHKLTGFIGATKEELLKYGIRFENKLTPEGFLICDTPGCNFAIDIKPIKANLETRIKKSVIF